MRKRDIFIAVPILIILVVSYIKYREIPYEDYKDFNLSEMKRHNDILNRITNSYAERNSIQESYEKSFYDCTGDLLYTRDETERFLTILDACKEDYVNDLNKTYYNQSWLMKDFNRYDGNYGPLQKVIQKSLKEPKTYKMVKTTYEMRLDDPRPHMFVSIDFRALNMYRVMLDRTMSVKVDAKTKEMYDLK